MRTSNRFAGRFLPLMVPSPNLLKPARPLTLAKPFSWLATGALMLAAHHAAAANFTWTGTTTNNWDTLATDLNWTTAWSNNPARSAPNTATFDLPSPAAITVNSNIDAGSITFTTGGWTVAPGTGLLAFGSTGNLAITTTTGIDTLNAPIVNGSTFGTLGGTTSLTKAGAGTLILAGSNAYTGSTSILGGTLSFASASNLPTASSLLIQGGTLDLQASKTVTLTKPISVSAGDLINSDPASNIINVQSASTLTTPGITVALANTTTDGFTKTGNGTLAITGGSTSFNAAGTSYLNAGTVSFTAAGALQTGGNFIASNTTIQYNSANSTSATALHQGTVTLNDANITITGNQFNNTTDQIHALVLGPGCSVISIDQGTSEHSTLDVTGGLTRNPGAVAIFTGYNMGSASNGCQVKFGTAPQLTNGILPYGFVDKNTSAGPPSEFAAYDTTLGIVPYTAYTTSFATSGPTSNLAISTNAAISADTTLNSLKLTGSAALSGSGTLTISSGGILALGAPNSLTVTTLNFGAADGIIYAYILTPTGFTIASQITGSAGVSIAGGITTLSGNNLYTGNTSIDYLATLKVSSDANLGDPSAGIIINQRGILEITADGFTTARPIYIASISTIVLDTGTASFNGAISGPGTVFFNRSGSGSTPTGTILLSAASTYQGNTIFVGNTFRLLNGDNRLPVTTALTLSTAILDLNGYNQTLASIAAGGATIAKILNAAPGTTSTLTITGAALYSGTIESAAGSVALQKTGTGALTLTAANSYTAGTTLAGGMLIVSNTSGSATGSGSVTLNAGILGGGGAIAGPVLAGSAPHTIAPSVSLAATAHTTLTLSFLATNPNTTLAFNLTTPGANSVNDRLVITSASGLSLNGGKLQITGSSAGPTSLGYYPIIQYNGTIQGAGLSSLTLPATANNITYSLDTTTDPGFIDLHKGFLGDANDDGIVNAIDLGILATNFNSTTTTWSQGDYNHDGTVNAIDLGILATNFNSVAGAASFEAALDAYPMLQAANDAETSAVPEPATFVLLAAGCLGLFARRRTRPLEEHAPE